MNEEYKPITNLWKDSEGYRYFGTLKLSSKIKYDGDDFIPLWEWINQLQQENQQLKDNWNKLKEIIRKKQDYYRHFKDNRYRKFLSELLDKMQELEGSDSNE